MKFCKGSLIALSMIVVGVIIGSLDLFSKIEKLKYEIDHYKSENKDLNSKLVKASHVNTCWIRSGESDMYKIGEYDKETDYLADLRVFKLVIEKDVYGKSVKLWVQRPDIGYEDIMAKGYKVKCPGGN